MCDTAALDVPRSVDTFLVSLGTRKKKKKKKGGAHPLMDYLRYCGMQVQ